MQLLTSHDFIFADAKPGCKHLPQNAWSLSVRYIVATEDAVVSAAEEYGRKRK